MSTSSESLRYEQAFKEGLNGEPSPSNRWFDIRDFVDDDDEKAASEAGWRAGIAAKVISQPR